MISIFLLCTSFVMCANLYRQPPHRIIIIIINKMPDIYEDDDLNRSSTRQRLITALDDSRDMCLYSDLKQIFKFHSSLTYITFIFKKQICRDWMMMMIIVVVSLAICYIYFYIFIWENTYSTSRHLHRFLLHGRRMARHSIYRPARAGAAKLIFKNLFEPLFFLSAFKGFTKQQCGRER